MLRASSSYDLENHNDHWAPLAQQWSPRLACCTFILGLHLQTHTHKATHSVDWAKCCTMMYNVYIFFVRLFCSMNESCWAHANNLRMSCDDVVEHRRRSFSVSKTWSAWILDLPWHFRHSTALPGLIIWCVGCPCQRSLVKGPWWQTSPRKRLKMSSPALAST